MFQAMLSTSSQFGDPVLVGHSIARTMRTSESPYALWTQVFLFIHEKLRLSDVKHLTQVYAGSRDG